MTAFDWADDGVFDISDDQQFKDRFNAMPDEDKNEILAALTDETKTVAERKKAVDFITKIGEMVIKAGGVLV